ncbi:MAG: GlsB/YeaQ/YmgE family stress response membrane protein [Comamonadaceae bacterium]|nr:MAG: GlsB/YeaQ/YmgE family stress response membrane protein [Comamonadaceae bacterium]
MGSSRRPGSGASINYVTWCAAGATLGWAYGLFARSAGRTLLVENIAVGIFGAFVAGDLYTALVVGAKPDGDFVAGALLPAVAGAAVAMLLVRAMRKLVGPLKSGKPRPLRR